MKTALIEYTGELRTSATHLRSGNKIETVAPPDNNGKGDAFSPTDLLAASLGACMMTIMGIVAERHQLDLTGTKIEVTKEMASSPRRVSGVIVEFTMPARAFSDHDKKLLEHAAHTCPVALSLHPDIRQQVSFNWT